MGQQVGRIAESGEALLAERRRVLHWSAEILARADENVQAEDSFLVDYDNPKIAAKVNAWLDEERAKIVAAGAREPEYLTYLIKNFTELGHTVQYKMRKDYNQAYKDLRQLTRFFDKLFKKQKRIHCQVLNLDRFWPSEQRRFRRKLSRLRMAVFRNLRKSEKMFFREKRLKNHFVRKIHDIDVKNMNIFKKSVQTLIKDFQDSARSTSI